MMNMTQPVDNSLPVETTSRIRKTSDDFESFFLYQTIELMTPDPDEDALLNGGYGEEVFRHELNSALADNITQSGGIGLSDTIFNELVQLQENQL